jgi:hypothetical protein
MEPELKDIADKETVVYTDKKVNVIEYSPKEQEEEYQVQMEGIPMPITFGKYGFFMHLSKQKCNKKRGYNIAWDAYLVYQHLIFTGITQKTNSVWANNTYIGNGLNITAERVRQAKSLLKDIDLIEYKKDQRKDKDKKGLFTKQYIKIITVTPLSHSRLNPLTAQTTTNALGNKENALGNNINAYKETSDKSLSNKKISNKDNISDASNKKLLIKENTTCDLADDIELIKQAYPAKTKGKTRERYTQRSVFNEKNIKKLIEKHGADYIIEVINLYVESQEGMYLQNFSTFINNFPSKEDFEIEEKETPTEYEEIPIDWDKGLLGDVS